MANSAPERTLPAWAQTARHFDQVLEVRTGSRSSCKRQAGCQGSNRRPKAQPSDGGEALGHRSSRLVPSELPASPAGLPAESPASLAPSATAAMRGPRQSPCPTLPAASATSGRSRRADRAGRPPLRCPPALRPGPDKAAPGYCAWGTEHGSPLRLPSPYPRPRHGPASSQVTGVEAQSAGWRR